MPARSQFPSKSTGNCLNFFKQSNFVLISGRGLVEIIHKNVHHCYCLMNSSRTPNIQTGKNPFWNSTPHDILRALETMWRGGRDHLPVIPCRRVPARHRCSRGSNISPNLDKRAVGLEEEEIKELGLDKWMYSYSLTQEASACVDR